MSSNVFESPDYMCPCAKTLRQANFSVTWWKFCPSHSDILSDEIADHIVTNLGGDQYC